MDVTLVFLVFRVAYGCVLGVEEDRGVGISNPIDFKGVVSQPVQGWMEGFL